jgi:hypothetical protein
VLGGRDGSVDSILLVFWVYCDGVQGPKEAGSWKAESAGQGSVIWKGRPMCLVISGCIADKGGCLQGVADLTYLCSEAVEHHQFVN